MNINLTQRQVRLWLCISSVILSLLWAAIARLILRPMLELAYRGKGLPALSNLVLQLEQPRNWLIWRLDTLTKVGFIFFLGFGLLFWVTTSRTFFSKFVGKATAETLGFIRILSCGFLLASVVVEDLPSSALLPPEMRVPMGFIDLLYQLPIGFDSLVRSIAGLWFFKILTALILLTGTIGWKTRFSIPIGVFLYLVYGGLIRHYEHFGHTGMIPAYLLIVLCFTPCGDGLSVDRRRRIAKGEVIAPADEYLPIYGWSRYACWIVMAFVYLSAGLSKVTKGGLLWWHPTNIQVIVFKDSLNPAWVDFGLGLHLISAPKFFFAFLGLMGLLVELGYVAVLFSRIARYIFPPLMGMIHLGILLLQNVAFFDLMLLQVIFYDFTKIRQAITQKKRGATVPEIALSHAASENPRSDRIATSNFFYPTFAILLVLFLCFVWMYRIEYYPVTAWQMYSERKMDPSVRYYKILAQRESGEITPINLDRGIGVMSNSRYKRVTRKFCFKPETVPTCQKYLQATASAYNKKVPPSQQIVQFIIQKWNWKFSDRSSPEETSQLQEEFIFKPEEN
ncbi:MAG: hypothetical protein SW833_26635 [Cyanobacteriota bacterium]|nr:hypothetical protein [Cyanobacteriota bacterium]